MTAQPSLIPEIEEAISRGSVRHRTQTLEKITDLFLSSAERLTEDQVALFDDVFGRLIVEIEAKALQELAQRMAPAPNAPTELVRQLAQNDDIFVAGPVLQLSARLEESDLLDIARTKGQAHLLAISGRRLDLGEAVTDVLVRRGGKDVVRRVANNSRARFSETGYAALIKRASQDGILAEQVGRREDLPPQLFRKLVIEAAAVVQKRLLATARPAAQAAIKDVLDKVADELGALQKRDYSAAQKLILELREAGRLAEPELMAFATGGRFEETVVALALLCRVPIDVVDRLIGGDRPDPVIILCRAMGFRWPTVAAVLSLRIGQRSPSMDNAYEQFERLSVSTARRVVHFWQARTAPAKAPAAAATA